MRKASIFSASSIRSIPSKTCAWPLTRHCKRAHVFDGIRSEEHTSELQSRLHLVCRLLLEKKKKIYKHTSPAIRSNSAPSAHVSKQAGLLAQRLCEHSDTEAPDLDTLTSRHGLAIYTVADR